MSEIFSKAEVITGVARRRRITTEQKLDRMLARHMSRGLAHEQDGQVATPHSNVRWCSDGLEFSHGSSKAVRVAFILNCHDREVIGWTATAARLLGEMIRDLMVSSTEARFGGRVRLIACNG